MNNSVKIKEPIMEVRSVNSTIKRNQIIDDLSFSLYQGEFLGIVGPNGSGKTSLISLIAGLRCPNAGDILLKGKSLKQYNRRDIAKILALVEQQANTTDRLTVMQAVSLGRTPHLSLLNPWSEVDQKIVQNALAQVGMTHFCNRYWHTLSGGERQRLHIARALAQQPEILIMDEPTNHLDIKHQLGLLSLVKKLGLTIVSALHDLNHAAMFCDRVMVMDQGKIVAIGTPKEIFTPQRIADVFNVTATIEQKGENHSSFISFQQPDSLDNLTF